MGLPDLTPNSNSFQFKKLQNRQLLPIVRTQKHFDIGPCCDIPHLVIKIEMSTVGSARTNISPLQSLAETKPLIPQVAKMNR